MSIVMISESLLLSATATDGHILRDRVLSGFGVRLNARKRTFLIATSVSGKQFRMMLGYWPLMTVDEARSRAMDVLRQCRNGGAQRAYPAGSLRGVLQILRLGRSANSAYPKSLTGRSSQVPKCVLKMDSYRRENGAEKSAAVIPSGA